jgi:DNA-binding NtrC family response regulator
MEILIVTGLSGAGKSQAIHFIEDMDYYCIDNMPPALIRDFVGVAATRGRPALRLQAETLEALAGYTWPGNIRELSNLIERLAILCPDRAVGIGDLPARYRPTDWTAPMSTLAQTAVTAEIPQLIASMAGSDEAESETVLPASVWAGEQDAITPPDMSRKMNAAVPRSKIKTIPRAGHLSTMEQPAEVTAAIENFLAEMK